MTWQILGAMLLVSTLLAARPVSAQTRVLDAMDDPGAWKVVTPEGVRLAVHADEGVTGRCLRLDYEFVTGGGYCIIQRELPFVLPENYEFAFHVRGEGASNNLEFKLVDKAGDSVWWVNRRAMDWPAQWTRLSNKKRRLEFAWGPSGGAPLTEVSRVEFAIASSSGGTGSVWLDEFTFRELPAAKDAGPGPRLAATASSTRDRAHGAECAVDGDANTFWSGKSGRKPTEIVVDLGVVREFGGVSIDWELAPASVDLHASDDGKQWSPLETGHTVGGPGSLLVTPDAEARHLRLTLTPGRGGFAPAIREVRIEDAVFSASPNAVIEHLAARSRRGLYPRSFLKEQSYWTVIGVDGDSTEALMNEEGAVEVTKRGFTIEPFLRVDGTLLTWAEGKHEQTLARGCLPIPTVVRKHEGLELEVAAFVRQYEDQPWLVLLCTVRNTGDQARQGALALAVRPFQVNPPWQRLNMEGGVAPIRSVGTFPEQPDGTPGGLRIKSARSTLEVWGGAGATNGACAFDAGDAITRLGAGGTLNPWSGDDNAGLASGLLSYPFDLAVGDEVSTLALAPMHHWAECPPAKLSSAIVDQHASAAKKELEQTEQDWALRVGSVRAIVPRADQWIADTFTSQLAYVLINRDGPALQPGSRSYERSWARDGSMTSAALLACGLTEEARAWVDWFGAHQFENGKVPCVVDARGPDPVPEHDSHGEYIWAVAQYYRYTRDAAFLSNHWPRVKKAVAYIQSLRAQRMTDEYKQAGSPGRAMYGLVPESISHEGYSAKPMHSYWDDFFVMLGLKEAAYLAKAAADDAAESEYDRLVAEFRKCLYDSIERAMAEKHIEYIPGCVELGDFDSTSTTIALFPCGESEFAPQDALRSTFERYWKFFQDRRSGAAPWEAYTPYEIRHVGAFVRLGEPERAYELLQWFGGHRRPPGWNHWAEVVWNDPKTPKFIGDMPHTWVGSDYLNSVLAMFVHERGDALVFFAGVPRAWVESGEDIGIERVRTPWGEFSARMRRQDNTVVATIDGPAQVPSGGLVLRRPVGCDGDDVTVRELPARVSWEVNK